MKMITCLFALLGTFSTSALAQQGQLGEWEDVFYLGPSQQDAIVAIHLIHLHTGKVVAISSTSTSGCDPNCCNQNCEPPSGQPSCVGKIYLWTPPVGSGSGTFTSASNCNNYVYCCGHSSLADGRALCAGGNWFQGYTDIFNPAIEAWLPNANMAQPRYYPSNTTLPDGKVLVSSGPWDPVARRLWKRPSYTIRPPCLQVTLGRRCRARLVNRGRTRTCSCCLTGTWFGQAATTLAIQRGS